MTRAVVPTIEFAMPSLGADMTDGRITEWLVQPGDDVERGQIVVVVETDKSDIEVEVFEPGRIVELLVPEGQVVDVGTPIALIAPSGAAPRRPAPPARPAQPTRPVQPVQPVQPASTAVPTAHITSPVLRHLADRLHVQPAEVHPSGAGGRVHRDDVERAAASRRRPTPDRRRRVTPRAARLMRLHDLDPGTVTAPGVVTGEVVLAALAARAAPITPPAAARPDRAETMRRHIADLMARSWAEIPHYHVSRRLDLTTLSASLAAHNDRLTLTERVVPGAALLCAAARAASAVPACNGWWRDGRFDAATDVRLGVVLSLRTGGIVVPTIAAADELSVDAMMARLAELVQRARQGRLRATDMVDATITVTNLGDRGAETVNGVIHPPQVALVGIGAIRDDVWAANGVAVVRPTSTVTLTGDHRAIDGLTGSRFLDRMQTALDQLLEEDRS